MYERDFGDYSVKTPSGFVMKRNGFELGGRRNAKQNLKKCLQQNKKLFEKEELTNFCPYFNFKKS